MRAAANRRGEPVAPPLPQEHQVPAHVVINGELLDLSNHFFSNGFAFERRFAQLEYINALIKGR